MKKAIDESASREEEKDDIYDPLADLAELN